MSTPDPPEGKTAPGGVERALLERMMESCRHYLLSVANRKLAPELRTKEGVSDVVQGTYLDAYLDINRFLGASESQLRAWLEKILDRNVKNVGRRYRGSRKRFVGREVPLEGPTTYGVSENIVARSSSSPSQHAIRKEQLDLLDRALALLSEKDRQLIIWRSQERLSFKELAARTGAKADTVQRAWARAILHLESAIASLSTTREKPASHTR